jgi:hypothetical protein
MDKLYEFLDKSRLFRRGGFVAIWIIVFWGFGWSLDYADAALLLERPGVDTAAVLAAIWAPITALAGYVFRIYTDGRRVSETPPSS